MIVTVVVPVVAVLVTENVRVTEQVGSHGLVVKLAVTPLGRVDVENVTGADMPWVNVAVIDEDGLVAPRSTVRVPGAALDRLKSKGGALTVSDSVVE